MKEYYYPKILVLLQFGIIGFMLVFSSGIFSSYFGMLVFLLGLVIGLWTLTHNKRGNFNIQPNIKEGSSLITTGSYKYIRHPMYTSVITMMLGVLISTATLLELFLYLLLITVLSLKAKREEMLWCIYDDDYIQYKKNTKLFIPYIL